MEKELLKVNNLKTSFYTAEGKVTAVNDVSFKVHEGKVLGIVGESGCGKSVTSMSIMRLLDDSISKIEEGEIIFEGTDILKLSEKEMNKIRGNKLAMIFQEPMTSLNPVFTIGQQIGEAIKIHQGIKGKENKEKSIEMLKLVGIPTPEKIVNEYPHQLSGGMRQRIMIAMALSCNPKLIIADEPTTALDVTIQAQVLELMKKLSKDLKTSIILITHDLGVIAEMADEVIVMYSGKVVEECSVQNIFEKAKHPYTKGLLYSRAENVKKGERLYNILGMVPNLNDMPSGCSFNPRCEKCMDICKEEMPKLIETEEGHKVRCWLYSGKEV
ncbi:oligopeptide/dipeptide ABC transporter ATP-binding protein [Clostridium saccharoperbutylacetonicum]|uniref:Oligopeptide transport ATP-binding protein OppD n=1 Tax=Clostridium saccharoperbutylacetonicum N1-4(HMT) TaxID=931276 RepID=M1MFR2_9CLOT|nr:ABC transporter ATP-binding protein [Clostridium saccharoperbutylacetonicum]AGF55208.1 oligopeptide transport ATP-binding protein OppD [Clostridium saccharoperbutylacetonicum N1-4(HMT)]NRT64081.1 oligopeptide/dipeptide ABC transporter ATP-binding protein [Clostridium saccharoperbutylacetonicum]NSB27448.1 oligopeptide/dipeptide ABC transporter ATP-binding protein [Clostridium saccharoperbutylacetonicum]NSB40937.1 oligopeptide/dipeptide ABC transporter ATP-binding protein [Clostridium saccharo